MFRLLNDWAQSLEEQLDGFDGGPPTQLLPNTAVENIDDRSGNCNLLRLFIVG